MNNKKVSEGAAKKGGLGIYIVLCVLIIVILGLILGIVMVSKDSQGQNETTTAKRNVVVNKDNVEEVVDKLIAETTKYTGPATYDVVMNSTWYFDNAKVASRNAYVENVKDNSHDVYFDVIRKDTEETIYESPLLPRGSYLEGITLDKELEAGTYDCVLIYHLVDENQNTLATLNMTLKIVMEN